jgi:hypothetical protein
MRRAGALCALLIVAHPAFTSKAKAAYDPIGAGMTRITLDKRFLTFLHRDRIGLEVSAGAKRQGQAISLPVSGGNLDPTVAKGQVELDGIIALRSARKRVPFRALTVKTKHSPLVAKVGGSQLKVATAGGLGSRREGFGTVFTAKGLRLSAKVATRLNKKLRPEEPFLPGQPIGGIVSKPLPYLTSILPNGRTTFVFDANFLAKLDEHFVSVNPVFPAEHVGATFTMPIIAGGSLAPDGSLGTLRTGGEIEFLQLGAGQVFWHELWFDLGTHSALAEVDVEPTPALPGKLGQVWTMDIAPGSRASDPASRIISLSGASLALTPSAAATFNQAFGEGSEVFKGGEVVGALTFAAQGQ